MKTPRHWSSRNLLSLALYPASLLYCLGAWMDRRFTRAVRVAVPVISVGNVTAGGAGKTPTTLALVPMLRALGYVPHILTRGYGGAKRIAHCVTAEDSAATVGDEALLLAKAAPTWVGRDRVASSQAAIAAGATIILCDDALQHHALYKDLSLLVIDGPFGFGNGMLLPAGPLRELPETAYGRANAVIIIGDDTQHLAATCPISLFHAALNPVGDCAFLSEGTWLAFAGIGRPEKFFASLRLLGATLVGTETFPDHYAYTHHDIHALVARAQALSATLITTEKDAVKIPAVLRDAIRVLPIGLRFLAYDNFMEYLEKAISPAPKA